MLQPYDIYVKPEPTACKTSEPKQTTCKTSIRQTASTDWNYSPKTESKKIQAKNEFVLNAKTADFDGNWLKLTNETLRSDSLMSYTN